jgi:hypothetical protein
VDRTIEWGTRGGGGGGGGGGEEEDNSRTWTLSM